MLSAMLFSALLCFAEELPEKALDKLSSDKFEVREAGQKELSQWALTNIKTSPESIYPIWKEVKDPEVKSRCYSVMKEVVILRRFGRPGFLGVRMMPTRVRAGEAGLLNGVRITFVMANKPAEKFDIHIGDVVIGVDEINLADDRDPVGIFSDYIRSKGPNEKIKLRILRNEKIIDKEVVLVVRPKEEELNVDPNAGKRLDLGIKYRQDLFFKNWLKEKAD